MFLKRKRKNDHVLSEREKRRIQQFVEQAADNEVVGVRREGFTSMLGDLYHTTIYLYYMRIGDYKTRGECRLFKCRSNIEDFQGYSIANPKIEAVSRYLVEVSAELGKQTAMDIEARTREKALNEMPSLPKAPSKPGTGD